MKLAEKILYLFEDSADQIWNVLYELELTDVIQIDFCEFAEDGSLVVSFVNKETDEEMTVVFTVDEEGTPIALYADSEDEEGNAEYVDLSELEVPVSDDKIDFTSMSQWLEPEVLLDILDGSEDDLEEASIYVVRGGKKVKKNLMRKKRRKPMTSVRRQAIRKAVIARRKSKAQANRKRAKSLRIRQRAKLKRNTNKRMRVGY